MTPTVPTLAECAGHGIEPMEFRVLIAPAAVPEKTAKGIILIEGTKERADFKAREARIVALGDLAHTNPDRVNPPRIGDRVLIEKYVGADSEIEGADGRKYRLVTDRDIQAVLERAQ